MNGNRRIVFLCHGAGNGGAERVIVRLSEEFVVRGYEVLLVTTNASHNDYAISAGVKREVILADQGCRLLRTITRIARLRSILLDFRPFCIVSFSAISNIQSIISTCGISCGVVVSERTDPSKYPLTRFGRLCRNFLYRFADRIVFQTPDAMSYFNRLIRRKGIVIPNPLCQRAEAAYDGFSSKTIVGVGSLGDQKNWSMALKACELVFARHPDYRLEIYGEGPQHDELLAFIEGSKFLEGRVYLKGFVSDIHDRLSKAVLYISSSNYEGISNAMLEALAVGTPAICTDCPVGGARMIIDDGVNGVLVPVNDYVSLADSMNQAIEDEGWRRLLSKNARKIRKQLEVGPIVDLWEREVIACGRE